MWFYKYTSVFQMVCILYNRHNDNSTHVFINIGTTTDNLFHSPSDATGATTRHQHVPYNLGRPRRLSILIGSIDSSVIACTGVNAEA